MRDATGFLLGLIPLLSHRLDIELERLRALLQDPDLLTGCR